MKCLMSSSSFMVKVEVESDMDLIPYNCDSKVLPEGLSSSSIRFNSLFLKRFFTYIYLAILF